MTTIKVIGMSCAHCQKAVERALSALGLQDVSVDLEGGKASFSPGTEVGQDKIRDAIEEAGYEVDF